jgi:sugar lactone lactonase YvrE
MRRFLLALVILLVLAVGLLRYFFGGGRRLEDRTADPVLPRSALELVADLPLPPGNLAVSKTGRVFFTFHPEASPEVKVAELLNGKPVPYPDDAFQHEAEGTPHFQTPLSMRIDSRGRLWVLDYGHYGFGTPRLLAFDLDTNRLADSYEFPAEAAGRLSMLNDFQVDPKGERIYIAESSIFGQRPALVVYDVVKRTSRRLLERHPSVTAKPYLMNAAGERDMVFFGLVTLQIGVDSIALDREGEWLYYAPVSDESMYRIRAADLDDASLSGDGLAAKVEVYGPKTLSDGLSTDLAGNVYLSDMEHSAILTLGPDRKLTTLVKDARLRWPDGFSFGPDGWLYVSASSLHHVILMDAEHVRAHAPYQIFRFQPGPLGVPGQ